MFLYIHSVSEGMPVSRRSTPRANARHRLIAAALCAIPFVTAAVMSAH
jgi:hypothetical protein